LAKKSCWETAAVVINLFLKPISKHRVQQDFLTPEAPSPAEAAMPPAKRTRKAARRRCEVELLRDNDTDDDLHLSPVSQARQATPIDSEPATAVQPTPDPSPLMPTTTTPAPPLLKAESPAGQPPPPSPPTTPLDREDYARASRPAATSTLDQSLLI
jgi:hypothetical protein